MDIYTQATLGTCNQFMSDGKVKKAEVSVVIAPLKVTTNDEGDKIKIVTGCSMWKSCQNPDCYYSIAARTMKKPQAGK
jgi:hypothetical protein